MKISINADGVINENIHNTRELLKERLEIFKKGEINCIDYTVVQKPITCNEKWCEMMAECLAETGIKVTQAHAPILATLYNKDGKCEWQMKPEDEKRLELAFLSVNKYGCKNMVMHPFSQYPEWNEKNMAICRQTNIDFFSKALKFAYKYDVNICLENMATTEELYGYCANPIELKELHDALNDKRIKYCVDTGHAHLSGYTPNDVITILGNDVQILHIQDNFGKNDGHCLPPFGSINWKSFAKSLADIQYSGTINFEIHGGRMSELDDEAIIAYLRFAKEMGEYLKRQINQYRI